MARGPVAETGVGGVDERGAAPQAAARMHAAHATASAAAAPVRRLKIAPGSRRGIRGFASTLVAVHFLPMDEVVLLRVVAEGPEGHVEKLRGLRLDAAAAIERLAHQTFADRLEIRLEIDAFLGK